MIFGKLYVVFSAYDPVLLIYLISFFISSIFYADK